jgi:transcriptional regulator with XRE-family HTH domain
MMEMGNMSYEREISESELISLRFMREIRQDLKITQAELGSKTSNSRSMITNLENNHTGTTWANALVILQRLGCRIVVECPELNRVYIVKDES